MEVLEVLSHLRSGSERASELGKEFIEIDLSVAEAEFIISELDTRIPKRLEQYKGKIICTHCMHQFSKTEYESKRIEFCPNCGQKFKLDKLDPDLSKLGESE